MYRVEKKRRKWEDDSGWSKSLPAAFQSCYLFPSAVGPIMAPLVWEMFMNFVFPNINFFHMAFYSDFVKWKNRPVKRLQDSNVSTLCIQGLLTI